MKPHRVILVSIRSIFIDPPVPVRPFALFLPWFKAHIYSINMQKVLANISLYLQKLKNYIMATCTYNIKVLAYASQ